MTGRSGAHVLLPGIFAGVAVASASTLALVAFRDRPSAVKNPVPVTTAEGTLATAIREARVLIASEVSGLRVRAQGGCILRDATGTKLRESNGQDWITFSTTRDGLLADGAMITGTDFSLSAKSANELVVSVLGTEEASDITYPGSLRLILRENGRLDVINDVDVEEYLACVVANEAWPSFHTEAFRVQAIVSRTFVLYQMTRRADALFDVGATQGSQVYRGLRTDTAGQRAADAVRFTRGVACTYPENGEDRLFCTYYSAACGGMSQSAAIFGPEGEIRPLSGGIACDYCRIAPRDTYRWGPLRVSLRTIEDRLSTRYPELSQLGRLTSLEVADRTPSGRPLSIRLSSESGQTKDILAERFRFALGASEFRSTDFQLSKRGEDFVFENGRGFGHGLGLCQWGAHGQAEQGPRAGEIIGYYYPGSKLLRVY